MTLAEFEVWLQAKKGLKPVEDVALQIESRHAELLSELSAWSKFVKNGTHKKRPFEPDKLRGDIADVLHVAIAADNADGGFKIARERIEGTFKLLLDTETEYLATIGAILKSAVNDEIDRRRFATLANAANSKAINKVFRDGLEAGGVNDEPDETDQETIAEHKATARGFVSSLGAVIFKEDGVSEAMAEQKPDMWFRKSILPAYYDGYTSARGNQMMEFSGDDGDESCDTCQRLKGQRHRLKDWKRKGVRPGVDTEAFDCGGWKCNHMLVETSGKASGNW